MIKQFRKIPTLLMNTALVIKAESIEVTKDGSPVYSEEINCMAMIDKSSKDLQKAQAQDETILGRAILNEDILGSVITSVKGSLREGANEYAFEGFRRVLNPDGSFYCTVLELR